MSKLNELKNTMITARKNYRESVDNATRMIILSIIGLFISNWCLHMASIQREMSIKTMIESHIFGGEWIIIIATICMIIYTIMMIWDSFVLKANYTKIYKKYMQSIRKSI